MSEVGELCYFKMAKSFKRQRRGEFVKIVFMGTPDFAAHVLKQLLATKHQVIAVFTRPDKPSGRKLKLAESQTKKLALQSKIPVFCPTSLKNLEVQKKLQSLCPDVIVVAAYGMILPKNILEIPRYGCVNVHASLLPKYRGAAPIQWALINGERETGVTIMFMEEGLDCGGVICQRSLRIEEANRASSLFARLAEIGAAELVKGLDLIVKPGFSPITQDENEVSWAPMLTKELGQLDFLKPADELVNLVRGLEVWPVAKADLAGQKIKIFSARVILDEDLLPGEIAKSQRLIVGCKGSAIELLEVAPENGKRMSGKAFVNGYLKR